MAEPEDWTKFTIFKQLGITPEIEVEVSFPPLDDSVCRWLGGEHYRRMPLNVPAYKNVNKPNVENDTITWQTWEGEAKKFLKNYCPADYQCRRWTFEGVVVFLYYWSFQYGYGANELQILLNRLCTLESLDKAIESANRIYNLAARVPAYKRYFRQSFNLTNNRSDFFWDRLSAHIRARSPLIHLLPDNTWQLAYRNMAKEVPPGVPPDDEVFPDDPLTAFRFPNHHFFLPINKF